MKMIRNFNIDYLLENNFELKIIIRGEEYYEQNMIKSVTWNNNNLEFKIIGTNTYLVIIDIEKGKINDFSCDCPYEYNCKHEVAALIYLYENLDEINDNNEEEKRKLQQLEEKIKTLSLNELSELTLELIRKNEKIRNNLLKKYKIGKK